MTGEWLLLVLAGVGAGLVGSTAGLASLVSYPALLATGLSPLAANVTNTTAMVGTTAGSVLGSRPELSGRGPRVIALVVMTGLGGAAGAALLLLTPDDAFEVVVPWLIAFGSILLVARDRVREWMIRRPSADDALTSTWPWTVMTFLVGMYTGYFGAGAGIILLAVLAVRHAEPLAVTNALKNVGAGFGNVVAALAYAFLAPVDWPAVVAVGLGGVAGGALGPQLVRIVPETPFRWAVAIAGLGLATYLAVRS